MKGQVSITATLAALALAGPATAADFEVTRTDDPPPNGCAPGDCSLREAVVAANEPGGPHAVLLKSGDRYTLTISGDANNSGDLAVATGTSISIRPDGARPATIDASGMLDRVISVFGDLDMRRVVIQGGRASQNTQQEAFGGGIQVGKTGKLTLTDAMIYGNSADQQPPYVGFGGGLYNAGSATLTRVWFYGNSARGSGFGGAVYAANGATTTIEDSVISLNHATFGAGLAGGGAIGQGGATTISHSRIGRNDATGTGGGVFAINGAAFILDTVGVDNNSAQGQGGGLRARDAEIQLRSATVTKNVAGSAPGISVRDDAGGGDGVIRLRGSVIAGNGNAAGSPDCVDETGGQMPSGGYNLIGDMGGTACITLAQPGDQLGHATATEPAIDAKLESEGPNGGPIGNAFLTNALLPGSPALDAGDPDGGCGPEDARGVPRKLGKRCDIGAYERVSCRGVLVNRVGTGAADNSAQPTLLPSKLADGYLGLRGADVLDAKGGNDGLCGGDGKDTLRGSSGDDKVAGDAGNDTLRGGKGRDELWGGKGRDVCVGGPGRDIAHGCEVKRSIP